MDPIYFIHFHLSATEQVQSKIRDIHGADYMISWSTTIDDARPGLVVSRFIACRGESNPEKTPLVLEGIPVERITTHVRAR